MKSHWTPKWLMKGHQTPWQHYILNNNNNIGKHQGVKNMKRSWLLKMCIDVNHRKNLFSIKKIQDNIIEWNFLYHLRISNFFLNGEILSK